MSERVLTVRQPWADLIMAGAKDVENRTWPVPSTLPQWWRCGDCGGRTQTDPALWRTVCGASTFHDEVDADGPFPFRLWIHAAKQTYQGAGLAEAWAALAEAWGMDPLDGGYRIGAKAMGRVVLGEERLGALLGSVTVTGCHHADSCARVPTMAEDPRPEVPLRHCSRWAEPDVWHWALADPDPLDVPVPMRGRQGLWILPETAAVGA